MIFVRAKTVIQGIHCWPEAPHPVDFLRNPHHHYFGIILGIGVGHENRSLEFLMLEAAIIAQLRADFRPYNREMPQILQFANNSCEMLAGHILSDAFLKELGMDAFDLAREFGATCTVDEDGRHSGMMTRTKTA